MRRRFFGLLIVFLFSVSPIFINVFSQMSLPIGKRLDLCESQWSATPIKTDQREDKEDPLLARHLDKENQLRHDFDPVRCRFSLIKEVFVI